MGRILEINGEYFVEFFGNGLRFQKKAGRSYEEARLKLQSIEQSLETSALKVDPAAVTIDMFAGLYRSFCEQVHRPKSMNRYKQAIDHFLRFLEPQLSADRYLREITPRIIELYKENLVKEFPGRYHLINFTLYLIRDILQHSITLGWLNDNPTQHTPFIKYSKQKFPRVYSEGHLEQIRSGLNEKEQQVLRFLVCCGMTPDELKKLSWEQVNLKSQKMEVLTKEQGDEYTRIVPMDYQLLEIIREIEARGRNHRFVFEGHPPLPFSVDPRVLRNTFAKRMLGRGVSLSQLYKLLGLDDIAKVFRYQAFLP